VLSFQQAVAIAIALALLTSRLRLMQDGEMSVAETMIKRFGGREQLAEALGVHVVQVYRWTYPKERKGTGGSIPSRHFSTLLKVAKERGIRLRPAELVGVE
jgi:DNA-binding phage protein